MEEENKKRGRKAGVKVGAYRGKNAYAERKPVIAISGYKEELDRLRKIADDNNETISRLVLRTFNCLNEQN